MKTTQRATPGTTLPASDSYHLFFHNHPLPMWLYDFESLVFLDVNAAAVEKYGYSRDEFLRLNIKDIRPPEEVARLQVDVKKKRPALQHSGEWRHRLKDGCIIDVEITSHTIEFNGRKAVLVLAQDLTERREADRKVLQHAGEIAALGEIMLELTTEHNLSNLLHLIVKHAAQMLGVKSGGMYMCESDSREVRCVISYNTRRDYAGTVLKYGEGAAGVVAQNGEPLIIDDYRQWPGRARTYEKEQPFSAVLSVPMIWQGQTLGVLTVLHTEEDRRFTSDEQELLTLFANQASIAVRNASLFEAAQKEITERQKVEQALRESEEKMRSIFRVAPTGIGVVRDRVFLEVNQRICEMTGYSEKELVEQSARMLYPTQEDFEFVGTEKYRQIAQTGSGEVETRWQKKDGTIIDILLASTPIDNADLSKGITFTALDITERKQAEQALRESEVRFRSLYENTTIGMYRTMPGGHISMANPALIRMLGYSSFEELVQRDLSKEGYEPANPRQDFQRRIEQDGVIIGLESAWKRKDGSVIYVRESAHLVRDENGQLLFYEGTVEDITEKKRAEKALRESHDRMLLVLDSVPADIYVADMQTYEILFMNQNMRKNFNGDLVGQVCWKLFRGGTGPCPHCTNDQLVDSQGNPTNGVTWEGQNPLTKCWYRNYDRAIRWIDGELVRLQIAVDITERKVAEDALRDSERKMHAVIDTAPFGAHLYELGTEQKLIFIGANRAADSILGTDNQQFVGQTIEEAFPPLRQTDIPDAYRRVAATGERYDSEQVEYAEGNIHGAFEVHAFQTGPNRMATFFRDITERKQAEDVLRLLSTRQEAILSAVPDILMEVNNDKIYTWANPAGLEFFGENVIGKDAAFYFEGEQETYKTVAPIFNGNQDLIYVESWQRRKDGEKRLLAWQCRVLKDSAGNVTGALSSAHDITERTRAEEEIRQLNATLEQRVEERTRELHDAQEQLVRQEKLAVLGQLAGGVGHELRNPLAVINNAVYLLKLTQTDADDKVKEYLGMIEKEIRTADKIITDLLDFARIKSVEREPASVSELVQHVLERYPAPPSVNVTLKIPASLPHVLVDPRQMEQVLGNLVVNACQAMVQGGVLTLSAKKKGKEVVLAVADTGVGITPENMKKLFEPLFTTKLKGIGLGLAVSRKLVEANDGRIEVQSEAGKGSTFTVFLPIGSQNQ